MKIIAIGDPHIKSDNINEFSIFENKLHDLIDREIPDIVVILGDVLHHHEKLYTSSLNRAIEFIENIGKKYKTFVLVGNHDMINNQQFLTKNHWMNGIKKLDSNITIVDSVVEYEKMLFCPYVFPGRFIEALNTYQEMDWKESKLIFAHQEFKGCKMGAIISETGDNWDENYPLVVAGHVHMNQWIGKNIFYTGSALQHAFGESEKNIIPVIEWKENKWDITEHDLGLSRKKIITVDLEKIDKIKIPEDKKDQIKLTVKGDISDFKTFKKSDKYKNILEKGIKIVFKPKEVKKVEISKNKEMLFDEILKDLVMSENNEELYVLYEKIVNDRDLGEIIFL